MDLWRRSILRTDGLRNAIAPENNPTLRCCAIAGRRRLPGLVSSRRLEKRGGAAFGHISIRVCLPRERRPSGFHHEVRLFVGRRDGPELDEFLALGSIDLLLCETDRYERRSHRAMNAVGGSTRLSRSARADEAAARRKLTNEETAALIADSLRSTLEFSPAGCALAHAVLRRATLPLRLSHRGLGLSL